METIQDLCQSRLLDRKWLIAPSLKTGTSWLEHVVRQGISCINTSPVTVHRLAMELAGCKLAEKGRTVLSSSMAALIVQSAWDSLPVDGYFRQLKPTYGLYKAIAHAIEDLRMQEVFCRGPIGCHRFSGFDGQNGRPRHPDQTLGRISQPTQSGRSSDRIEFRNRSFGIGKLAPQRDRFAAEDPGEFEGLELRFLQAIPAAQRIPIECPLDLAAGDDEAGTEFSFFRAIGEVNEVREVLRRCCEESVSLDCVEILHTDGQTYVPLVHEIASLVDHAPGCLPVTFADGLPIALALPIKALRSILRWADADFPQQLIVEVFNEGLLDTHDFSGPALARILRPLGIKSGSQNYGVRLQQQIDAAKVAVERLVQSKDHETKSFLRDCSGKLRGLRFSKRRSRRWLD